MGHAPVVALLSDFGLQDHYVGTMKGVVLGICPEATLVDVTHDIPPQDVLAGAFELAAAFSYFPEGTVFVAVVDPGVGSDRLAIAVEAAGRYLVGPDNGLLSLVLRDHSPARIVELSEPRFALPRISRTFEGRDRFAPAGAWLARGTGIAVLGRPLEGWTRLNLPEPQAEGGFVDGEVIRVDRFGNLITNIGSGLLSDVDQARLVVEVAGQLVEGVVRTYSSGRGGALCALIGSTGYLEVSVRGGSAAAALRSGRGAPVRVWKTA